MYEPRFLHKAQSSSGANEPADDALLLPSLPRFLRVLLITDGTVTSSLEAYFGEPIAVDVISHREVASERSYPALGIAPADRILRRLVTLRGKRTHEVYAFAESVIVIARLTDELRGRLLDERKGIGELLREGRCETYREILETGRRAAGTLAGCLSVAQTALVAGRRYVIYLARQPAIEIEEVFPESRFRDG